MDTIDLEIFDVEHGACALLTCPNGDRLMIDCGHNADTDWSPGTHMRGISVRKLEMLAITNYDEDHVSGIRDLRDNVPAINWLWRNPSVTTSNIREMKRENGVGPGIEKLIFEIDNTFTGDGKSPQPEFPGLKRRNFYNNYPDFTDENNLSMVLHLSCQATGVLFPGDLEKAGWGKLLEQEDFRNALENTQVFVASHHGRENGYLEEVFDYCHPHYVVISDRGYVYDTQETVPKYRSKAYGGPFRSDAERKVLTTRNDGTIKFSFGSDGWGAS